jgi:hypothetical protein
MGWHQQLRHTSEQRCVLLSHGDDRGERKGQICGFEEDDPVKVNLAPDNREKMRTPANSIWELAGSFFTWLTKSGNLKKSVDIRFSILHIFLVFQTSINFLFRLSVPHSVGQFSTG